jgi:hypothetical protein
MKMINGQIVNLKKLRNSINGNPKYLVRIYKVDETIELRTATDAGFVYAIDPNWLNKWAVFKIGGDKRQTIRNIDLIV